MSKLLSMPSKMSHQKIKTNTIVGCVEFDVNNNISTSIVTHKCQILNANTIYLLLLTDLKFILIPVKFTDISQSSTKKIL